MQAFHDDLTGLANRALFKDRVEHALTRRAQGRRLGRPAVPRPRPLQDRQRQPGPHRRRRAPHRHRRATPHGPAARGHDRPAGRRRVRDPRRRRHAPEDVLALAERVLRPSTAPFRLRDREITIRCSIGVVLASGGHHTADDLLRDADVAMYRAKVSGRGSYALFEPSMQAEVAARQELESDLREAIEHERLTLAYQPIVDLRDGASSPSRRSRAGRIPSVATSRRRSSSRAPRRAASSCRSVAGCFGAHASTLPSSGSDGGSGGDLRLSVNLSPRQLGDRRIVDDVLGALAKPGCRPTCSTSRSPRASCSTAARRASSTSGCSAPPGCGVAFDDFGTGFSSLGNLRSLPIDGLKIDRSFVASMLDGGVDAAVVEAIIRLGAALHVAVVAEGIEDAATPSACGSSGARRPGLPLRPAGAARRARGSPRSVVPPSAVA